MVDVATLFQWTLISLGIASVVAYFGLQGLLVYVREEADRFVSEHLPLALTSLDLILRRPVDQADFRKRLKAERLDVTQNPDPSSTLHVIRAFTWAGVGLAVSLVGVFILLGTVLPHLAELSVSPSGEGSALILLSLAFLTDLGCIVTVLIAAARHDAAVAILKVLLPWMH